MGERRSRRSAAAGDYRATLRVACLMGLALISQAEGRAASAVSDELREKDVRRAEKVLAKLRLLQEATATHNGANAFRPLAAKLYPGLFVTVAEMSESDLKTDLDTAVFLYEEVGRTWFTTGARAADCGREREDIYLPLCLDLRGGTARQLLLSKARLHARWAEAVVKNYRGAGGTDDARALSAMRAARANDQAIAARVVETLKDLEGLAQTLPERGGGRVRRNTAGADSDQPEREFDEALRGAGALLASMPRSPMFYQLSGARRSYKDWLFWQSKVSQSRALVVSANSFNRSPLEDLRLDADQVGQTVAANRRAATKYIRMAEHSLSAMARR